MVVIDSVGGMIGKSEFEKDADEAVVAEVARIVTRMVKQISPLGADNRTTTLVINQVRANIDGNARGPKTGTSGGWALKHITTIRIRVRRGADQAKFVTVGGERVPVGYPMVAIIEKNKCAPYGSQATIWLFNQATTKYGPVGVDMISEAWDFGTRYGIIARGGANYTFPNGEVVRTADAAEKYLRENPVLAQEIREKVLEHLRGEIHEEQDNGSEDLDLSGV
jgi:recombination protein RecA